MRNVAHESKSTQKNMSPPNIISPLQCLRTTSLFEIKVVSKSLNFAGPVPRGRFIWEEEVLRVDIHVQIRHLD